MKHIFYLFISVASIFTLLLVSNCAPRRTENSSDIFASGKINNRIDSCLSESDYTAKEVVIPKQPRNWSEKNSEEYLDKYIYMVNVHEDVITSVSRLFSVFSWDGFASCVYTHIDSNHTFSRASNTYFDDAYEKAEIEEFKFDKVGKIVLE